MNKTNVESLSEIHPSSLILHPSKIASILLAAGAARRMEYYPKQLLEFRGETLLRRAAKTALAARCHPICVVLGANAEQLKTEIADLPVEIAVNKNWASGKGSSLKIGLEKLLEIAPEISAVGVLLADQPLINSQIINRLIEIFERGGNQIVACEYEETVGVPAIFGRSLFAELLNLSGDAGAKKIIGKHFAETARIVVPEAALDIDSRQDYEHLIEDSA